jgi:NAD(P)-dependent dehydrogenase (short-subunit alcohol dehydrogenase family)
MAGFLENKNAIVTGASRGIGRAIAQALLREGASVAICGRSQAGVDEAVRELNSGGSNLIGAAIDVSDAEAVSDFFHLVDEQLGGLDILVNNAGIGIFRSVSELSFNDWRQTLDTNLSGVFYCCHEAIPRLRHRGGGAIINVSSLAGRNAFAGGAAYNASKFGLNGFSEALMLDHRYDKIRVSYVMPGSVDTEFGGRGSTASWKMAPEDVADAVLMILKMPERTTISRVEMRPSMPPK